LIERPFVNIENIQINLISKNLTTKQTSILENLQDA
jgi:hypothetical protein